MSHLAYHCEEAFRAEGLHVGLACLATSEPKFIHSPNMFKTHGGRNVIPSQQDNNQTHFATTFHSKLPVTATRKESELNRDDPIINSRWCKSQSINLTPAYTIIHGAYTIDKRVN